MEKQDFREAILGRLRRRYEVIQGATVPGGLLPKIWRWCEVYGDEEVLEMLAEADRVDQQGSPVRSLGRWMETALADRAVVRARTIRSDAHTNFPEPPCGCEDGMSDGRCCRRCPRGRERAKRLRLAYEREYVEAMEKARSISDVKKLEEAMGRKLSSLFGEIPGKP